ncbi:MAG TPA: inositol monophosphatase family protein [Blastocatellia bacterium]|nr:inositol monophosphatase family protein [Blastocatellia bacterium]
MLEFAIRLAQEAGKVLRDNFGRKITISNKGEIDLVTEADLAAEKVIKDLISSHYPKHQILAEESGAFETSSEYRWIIDPLDGTTNYAHGLPIFCVSIALERAGEMIIGVIYDPIRDEMFVAERGSGATLNNRSIQTSETESLKKALLVTGFPYDVHTNSVNNIDNFANFMKTAQAVRRLGSAAIDLCYVAAGRFDGFWEMKLNAWDMAAGALIVEEAGGQVTAFNGGKFDPFKKEICASNGLIHKEMVTILQRRAS